MDWSWFPPAAFSALLTLVATWTQILWQTRNQGAREKRARKEGRYQEVRRFLLLASRAVHEYTGAGDWGEWVKAGTKGKKHQDGFRQRSLAASRELLACEVGTAPGLFVADEPRLFGKINEVLEVVRDSQKAALDCMSGTQRDDLMELRQAVGKLVVDAQLMMDKSMEES